MQTDDKPGQWVKGALWLTLSGIVAKLLSAGYRIPLQNLTGDVGFYVYQQVYPLLSIAMMFALYGFPSAISKITSDMGAMGKGLSWRSFYVPLVVLLFAIAGSASLFLFASARGIAGLAGDFELTHTYRLASLLFLLLPLPSLIRGVFQGSGMMQPTVLSQLGEQLLRVSVIITAATMIYLGQASLYTIGPVAVVASITGFVAATTILVFCFKRSGRVSKQQFPVPWRYYTSTLVVLATTAALNHMVLVIIQLADTMTLVPALQAYGLSADEAKQTKGIFDRGQPLIQLGTVLGSSFALALLPALSGDKLKQAPQKMQAVQSGALFSFYLAVGAMTGLIMIFPETNRLLFQSADGTRALRVLAVAVFLGSVGITAASILQGIGYIRRTAVFVAIAFVVKWITNHYVVPLLGMMGSAIATVISLAVFAGLMVLTLRQKLPALNMLQRINWSALMMALVGMIGFILGTGYLIGPIISRVGLAVYVIVISLAGGTIYLGVLLRFKAFTEQDLSLLPLARLLIRFHKARDS